MRIKLLSGFLFLLCFTSTALAKQESFPFLSTVIKDNVNLRAGQNTNFERLCQLKQGDELVVVEKSYSWYKVRLPASASIYVSAQYIKLVGANIGEIMAKDINLRAGANVERTVVGKVTLTDKIRILKQEGEWYKIEPPWDSFGWISEDFISFKSKDVSARQPKPVVVMEAKVEPVSDQTSPHPQENLTGTIQITEDATRQRQYRILLDDQTSLALEGFEQVLPEFVDARVVVSGVKESSAPPTASFFKVSKIKLIL